MEGVGDLRVGGEKAAAPDQTAMGAKIAEACVFDQIVKDLAERGTHMADQLLAPGSWLEPEPPGQARSSLSGCRLHGYSLAEFGVVSYRRRAWRT
jgi:hypothetical protein